MSIDAINTMIDTFIRLDKAPLPEHPDKGFNMATGNFDSRSYTQHNCGTAACIFGWHELLFGSIEDVFGLNDDKSKSLTNPGQNDDTSGCLYHYGADTEKFTLRAAIRVLQILRDTGEVNWNEAIANPWSPEDEKPAKPSFDGRAWLDSMLDPTLDAAIPLLEGPKRESVK